MRRSHLRVVGGLDAERVARALAEVSDEAPGDRLASLAQKLAGEGAPRTGQPADSKGESADATESGVRPEAPAVPGPVGEPPADLLRRTLIEYGEVLKRYREDFDRLFAHEPAAAAGGDETLRRLHQARLLLVKYPVAAQALFAALVAEGRRYAETPEGRVARARLADSDLVRKGRAVFEAVSAGLVSEHEGPLPSAFLEAFLEATRRDGLEAVLGQVFGGAG